MTTTRADLILHPVRLRLLAALARRQLTARQLSELLPDVPQATLYHHLGILTRAGLLRIVAERQVRGTVEKRYAFAEDHALLGPADLAKASHEDHLRYFTMFVALLLGDFARYLEQGGPDKPIDLLADGAGYNATPFYLSDEELAQASAAVNKALLPFYGNQPAPHRRRHLLALITFPDADPDADPEDARHDARHDAEPSTDTVEE